MGCCAGRKRRWLRGEIITEIRPSFAKDVMGWEQRGIPGLCGYRLGWAAVAAFIQPCPKRVADPSCDVD